MLMLNFGLTLEAAVRRNPDELPRTTHHGGVPPIETLISAMTTLEKQVLNITM